MWRWLPVRRRLRLATLRWLWLWGLWLLLLMGTVPRLLKGTLRPEDNKSPSQHCATGRGPVLAVPTERGQLGAYSPPLLSRS